jgi:hypothetical protein
MGREEMEGKMGRKDGKEGEKGSKRRDYGKDEI